MIGNILILMYLKLFYSRVQGNVIIYRQELVVQELNRHSNIKTYNTIRIFSINNDSSKFSILYLGTLTFQGEYSSLTITINNLNIHLYKVSYKKSVETHYTFS